MIEREMEDLLWEHPGRLLDESLEQFQRQPTSEVGRADLVFRDRLGRLLVVELKHGRLQRGAIEQLVDYFGMMKQRYPDTPVELMIVANDIPRERKLACERFDIIAEEIPETKFRKVAEEVGYVFKSEAALTSEPSNARFRTPEGPDQSRATGTWRVNPTSKTWFHWKDPSGRGYFLAFVNARGSCSIRVFDETSGAFGRKEYKSGSYEVGFSEYLETALELRVNRQPNLERDCKHALPSHILSELQQQLGGVFANESSNSAFRAAEESETPKLTRISPLNHTSKGWFHWKDSSGRGYFLAFVNARGSCSIRVFDETSGAFGRKEYKSGSYEVGFSEYLETALELRVNRQPNLERDCKHTLPSHILSELQQQIR